MRWVRVAAAVAAIGAVAAFAGVGRPDAASGAGDEPAQRTITVTGAGSVKAAPDTATWSFGVTTQAATAKEALAQNSERMTAVIEALKTAGIAETDIQTSQVSIYPSYDPNGQQITGYQAQNQVNAVVKSIDASGDVIDAATKAGANTISGPTLSISKTDDLYETALGAAFDQAKAKAGSLAEKAGVSLGQVVAIVEASYSPSPIYASAEKLAAADSAGAPISVGQSEVTANVTVTFAIG